MSTPGTTDAPAVHKTLFTDGWLFRSLDSDVAVAVRLPHDAMIGEPRSADAETGNHGGYFPGGAYLYTKSWDVPADADTRVISLLFEGVYGATVIRINGQQAAMWDSGYRETVVPMSLYITAGESALIEVSVDNTRTPNARWYTGSGIYRPVWLQNTGLMRFARDGVRVVARSIADPAQLDVTVHIEGAPALGAQVNVDVLDAGVVIGAGSALVEEAGAVVTVDVPSPRAWSAEDPHLYEIAVTLVADGSTADEHRERIGLRTMSIDASTGLRINGKQVNLRGACVHHDNGILGAATMRPLSTDGPRS